MVRRGKKKANKHANNNGTLVLIGLVSDGEPSKQEEHPSLTQDAQTKGGQEGHGTASDTNWRATPPEKDASDNKEKKSESNLTSEADRDRNTPNWRDEGDRDQKIPNWRDDSDRDQKTSNWRDFTGKERKRYGYNWRDRKKPYWKDDIFKRDSVKIVPGENWRKRPENCSPVLVCVRAAVRQDPPSPVPPPPAPEEDVQKVSSPATETQDVLDDVEEIVPKMEVIQVDEIEGSAEEPRTVQQQQPDEQKTDACHLIYTSRTTWNTGNCPKVNLVEHYRTI